MSDHDRNSALTAIPNETARQAWTALVAIRGQEAVTFKHLAKLIRDDQDRPAALTAIQKVRSEDWAAPSRYRSSRSMSASTMC